MQPTAEPVVDAVLDDLALYERMINCEDPDLRDALQESLTVVLDAIRLYGPDGCYTSFNGGKDAVVVLHILRAALAHYCRENGISCRPKLIYFEHPKEFGEIARHVRETVERHNLDMVTYQCKYSEGLADLILSKGNKQLAFILGTRKGDPNCRNQNSFSPSSAHMPPFMRVNPILDWSYGRVWNFLRTFDLEYCSLYDEGYTSLGKTDDTWRNPALARSDGLGYQPAYMLIDWSMERSGRGASEPQILGGDSNVIVADSAGIVVIGDEVLKGKVEECNSRKALLALRRAGVPVSRLAMVQDVIDEIVDEIKKQSEAFDVVITSGGVGPTHDDVTLKAVCRALGVSLEHNMAMEQIIRVLSKVPENAELNDNQKQSCRLPQGARLLQIPGSAAMWPILLVRNIFVLPGIPQFFESKVNAISTHFISGRRKTTRQVALRVDEPELVSTLNDVVERNPLVSIGSYPFVDDGETRTIVTFEGLESDVWEVEQAVSAFVGCVPNEQIVSISDCDALTE